MVPIYLVTRACHGYKVDSLQKPILVWVNLRKLHRLLPSNSRSDLDAYLCKRLKSKPAEDLERPLLSGYAVGPVLVLAISITKTSVAPTAVRSSILVAILLFSTIAFTATQSESSKAVIVGARFPGVISVA